MKTLFAVVLVLVFGLGCARVRVEAPKEAIKVDVSMRLDIYQHVQKDIDNIEDMISGPAAKTAPAKDKSSLLDFFIGNAYAEDLGPAVHQAIERRKERRSQLVDLEARGAIGETRWGLVEAKASAAQDLVQAENNDRLAIYNAIAAKNGSSVDDVKRLYAQRLQADAPSGTPIETDSGWQTK